MHDGQEWDTWQRRLRKDGEIYSIEICDRPVEASRKDAGDVPSASLAVARQRDGIAIDG
jgi:hypothetical protein